MPRKTLRIRLPRLEPVKHTIRFVLGVTLAGVTSMLVAFLFIQYLMRDLSLISTPEPQRISDANELRAYSNDLLELATEFLARTANEGFSKRPEFERWRTTVFYPRIKDLRERIAAVKDKSPLLAQLLEATDKLSAMAATPEQPRLRRQVADEVLKATGAAEGWIAENNLGQWLDEPGHIPAFGRAY